MITLEKDGVRMSVKSEIQASAFLSSGWNRVEVVEKAQNAPKPRATRQTKK